MKDELIGLMIVPSDLVIQDGSCLGYALCKYHLDAIYEYQIFDQVSSTEYEIYNRYLCHTTIFLSIIAPP